jgi:acetyltransferase
VDNSHLDFLFRPKSVAVIGASATPGKIGYSVMYNLLEGKYEGKIYPINNKLDEILGIKCHASILDVPGPVDIAVVTVPAKICVPITEECGKKGVKALVIITSGFSEVGEKDLEQQMVDVAKKYNMRILGPNIVGYLSNSEKLNASFAPFLPLLGKASLISQSGALLIALDAATYSRRVGFEKLLSIGNMSDLDFSDMIEWLNDDVNTSCISLYIEGFKDGRKFIDQCRKTTKPIIALKAGVSAHGAAAAASHTGSLAGAAKVYGAAFQQAGVVQATDLDNLFDRTLAFSLEPQLKGDNLLVITNGGGVGVLATDAAERYGIPLKFAPKDVQEELKKHMPDFGSAKNPVDLTGMAGPEWYKESVLYAIKHEWVDGVIVLYCETAITNPSEIAQAIFEAVKESGVTDKPVTVSFVGGEKSENGMQWLVENGIPAYGAPDIAMNAMAALREYAKIRETLSEKSENNIKVDKAAAQKVIAGARATGRDSLTEIEAKQVFEAYGLPVTKTYLAKSEDEAVALAKKIGFPVVMKIVSPDILHKSDAGAVKVNIKEEQAVRDAYKTILKNSKAYKANADIHGVAVQEMAPSGTEVIMGSVNDPTFGPTMMFGLGGIFVEVLKDVTFRVAPVSMSQARHMIDEIRGAPILAGVRGESPRDRVQLADTVCRYSKMILDLGNDISESDANPILVYEEGKGVKVVDARVILKKK